MSGIQRNVIRTVGARKLRVRRAMLEDIDAIWEIQSTVPEASQWHREDYLAFDCTVAECNGRIAGFLVSRQIGPGEREILNVAVQAEFRRLGAATKLIQYELDQHRGDHFLEVRESNAPARRLYERLGFREVGVRAEYYENPTESGIVMRFFS